MQLVVDRCFKLGYYGNSFATEGAWPPRSYDLSNQIERLLDLYPEVFQGVSYEGNGYDSYGNAKGNGTWLYLNPGWRYDGMGMIHEHTIKEVMDAVRFIYHDKDEWIVQNPDDEDLIRDIESGKYDCERFLKRRGAA